MTLCRSGTIVWLILVSFSQIGVIAEPKLTGITLYSANVEGSGSTGSYWNTRGGDFAWNVYLFTGSVAAPSFLNSGDTDDSLNPQLSLSPGVHVIQFAGASAPSGFLGLNLYFNGSSSNRISAVVPRDGSGDFQVVRQGLGTYGQSGSQPSAGALEFARVGDHTVVLSDFRVEPAGADVVSAFRHGKDDGRPDTVGSLTLFVVPSLQLAIEVSEVRVCWYAETNKLYQLQYQSTETINRWSDLGAPTRGDGSRFCVNDPVIPARPRRYYRIVESP